MSAPDFWSNQEKAQEVVAELKRVKGVLKPLEELIRGADDLGAMLEMAEEDESFAAEVPGHIAALDKALEALEVKALLSGPMDANGAILSINARDGGTDANDWADMLLRMYIAWAQDHDYQVELLDRQDNEEAGIQSAAIAVRGPMAYGYLKGESGIHRLVRISPFNAEGKRQTSFAAVDVSPEVSDTIEIELRDEDIEEQVFRASGPGGQHVNKTSSAVRLTHLPTGIVVACQAERSQHKNRATAMKMLRARLARIEEEKREAEQAAKYNQMPKTGFGSQIRSYFLHPDQRIKDSRTGYMETNFHNVLDGHIQAFLDAYLRWRVGQQRHGG
jgi:peptide chain release factor 2